jgi:hypothetical protein
LPLKARQAAAFASALIFREKHPSGQSLSVKMVLLERIELSTSPLPRVRSTTELQQRAICRNAGVPMRGEWPGCQEQHLAFWPVLGSVTDMTDKDERAKRLAEELRKNLRRRKGQAREQDAGDKADKK